MSNRIHFGVWFGGLHVDYAVSVLEPGNEPYRADSLLRIIDVFWRSLSHYLSRSLFFFLSYNPCILLKSLKKSSIQALLENAHAT